MNNSKSKNQTTGSRPGFTLVELLVVILIIAILVALSFVGVKRVRAMADKSNSIRNISQLQIANMNYAADHNGQCVPLKVQEGNGPVSDRWHIDLEYISNLTGRPADEMKKTDPTIVPLNMLDPKVVRARKTSYERLFASYGMNDTGLMATAGGSPRSNNLNQISDPARSMAFATATDYRVTYNSRYKWDFKNPKDEKTANGELAYRHGDKILVVYFDGHVGEVSKGDLEQIDKAGGLNNVFWRPKQ